MGALWLKFLELTMQIQLTLHSSMLESALMLLAKILPVYMIAGVYVDQLLLDH